MITLFFQPLETEDVKMKPKVLVTCQIAQEPIEKLRESAEVKLNPSPQPFTKEQLRKEVADVDGVILGAEKFDEELIAAAPRLKIIARYGVGYDNVDVRAATSRRIFVTYTPSVLSDAVADLTFAFILALSRRITEADSYVKSGEWSKNTSFPLGYDLANKTLGIVGCGRIGMKVIERARAFNMNIIYHDVIRNTLAEEKYGAKSVTLEELLRWSDYVSIHVPFTQKTEGLVGKNELMLMKSTAFLINTSRGPVVDQLALYEALKGKRIAGAGLDVFQKEPLASDDPMLKLSNVVLTPHIGSGTVETRLAMAMMAVDDVIRVLRGKEPTNVVNNELLERK